MQVLLPEPVLTRLRLRAAHEDRPMSELVRRATERWLDSLAVDVPGMDQRIAARTFDLGGSGVPLESLRELAYEESDS